MIKIVVFGSGNVGKAVAEAVSAAGDMELTGIVSKTDIGEVICGVRIEEDMDKLPAFDVAVLALPSRAVPSVAAELLSKGIHTVDSFDIHTKISEVRKELDDIAKKNGVVSVLSAGWDPGSDSILRTLFLAMAPNGITYTDFGPGMSMGHTVAAKAIKGVKDALSMTIPTGTGIHRRMVYIELLENCSYDEVAAAIKADEYFVHDETFVQVVDSVTALKDVGHGVHIERKGVSGQTHNQLFEFNMKINNPALTGQILAASARAALRQKPGCYTLIEIPPVDFLALSREEAVQLLV